MEQHPLNTDDPVKLRKALERAYRKVNILENMIEHQTRELYYKNLELTKQNAEMEQFVYVASHDLQEPLITILSYAGILQEEYNDRLDEEGALYIGNISRLACRMRALIKDLLDYSRLGRDKTLQKVDCNRLMAAVLENLQSSIRATGAKILVEDLPELMAYPIEMEMLFQNLISNAIKFRKKQSVPVISISARREEQAWQFLVRDNGIGIDEEYREKIFIIFQRLHTKREYEGNGIGLSHCRKIVSLHEGRIWVESSRGKGSSFYFTIKTH